MSEDDLERVRRAGEQMGRMLNENAELLRRVARLENAFLGIIGAIVAAYTKAKGLW